MHVRLNTLHIEDLYHIRLVRTYTKEIVVYGARNLLLTHKRYCEHRGARMEVYSRALEVHDRQTEGDFLFEYIMHPK